MHVISRKKLLHFSLQYPESALPLDVWYRLARKSKWTNFGQLTSLFGRKVDKVGKHIVFDFGGNKFRLIVICHFNRSRIYIRHVLTHAEYDLEDWKDE